MKQILSPEHFEDYQDWVNYILEMANNYKVDGEYTEQRMREAENHGMCDNEN